MKNLSEVLEFCTDQETGLCYLNPNTENQKMNEIVKSFMSQDEFYIQRRLQEDGYEMTHNLPSCIKAIKPSIVMPYELYVRIRIVRQKM